ncbi:DUF3293 domain-containing protein [Luteimonas abyssi]|uniref:DUF3293 domain-containing protein n=1 Tax=Luteimonas abyssi TaxID=1247514 RepID=UPI000737B810|nr:DUF3293 domain-containing protein [Luteimonas abyssi]
MQPIDDARATTLFDAYLRARYRVSTPSGWLPLETGRPVPLALRRALSGVSAETETVATAFGVITAFNPGSSACDAPTNRAADAALHEALRDSAPGRLWRTRASAADGRWPEDGWLASGLTTRVLDALACRFGQLGTLHAEDDAPIRLRLAIPMPAALPPHPHVDWRVAHPRSNRSLP